MTAYLHRGMDVLSSTLKWPRQIRSDVESLGITFGLSADLLVLKNEHTYSTAIKAFRSFSDLSGVSEIFNSLSHVFNVIKLGNLQGVLLTKTVFAVGNISETISWMNDYKIVHLSKKLNDTLSVVTVCTSLIGFAALTKENSKNLKDLIVNELKITDKSKNNYSAITSAACSLTSSATQIGAIVLPLLSDKYKNMSLYCSIASKTTNIAAFLINQNAKKG